MNKNKVLELAREAGFPIGHVTKGIYPAPGDIYAELERFAALVERDVQWLGLPVAWMYDFLNPGNRDEVIRNRVTQNPAQIDYVKGFNVRPLYSRAPRELQVVAEVTYDADREAIWFHGRLPSTGALLYAIRDYVNRDAAKEAGL